MYHYIILSYIILYHITLYYIMLHYIILYCTISLCVLLYYRSGGHGLLRRPGVSPWPAPLLRGLYGCHLACGHQYWRLVVSVFQPGRPNSASERALGGLKYISFGLQTTAKSVKILPVVPGLYLEPL